MPKQVVRQVLNIKGMTCQNCERRIERTLKGLPGVFWVKASFWRSDVEIEFDRYQVSLVKIKKTLENLDYQVTINSYNRRGNDYRGFLGFLVVVTALYLIVKNAVGFNYIPQIEKSMGFGLLFLAGLLTSVHCIAMCGGIVLSQTIRNGDAALGKQLEPQWMASFLYNVGRVVSYTLVGGWRVCWEPRSVSLELPGEHWPS